jgi:oxygen-independent coproporphyrinogen III oxidase
VIDHYLSGLLREIASVAACIGPGRDVLQLHLGGGSANELYASQLLRLVDALQRHWRLPADAEMSADCDPRGVSWTQLQLLRSLGFRRLNFGVFELDPVVQQAIGRGQSLALLADVCDMARACGVESINLEMMMGLPHQTEALWRNTMRSVIDTGPDRVTLTRYRHRPWLVPTQRAIDAQALPSGEQVAGLASAASSMLCDAGYRWIGADQFVLDSDELAAACEAGRLRRSLISYTAMPGTPMLGMGVGAVGEIDGQVFWNEASLPAWHGALDLGRLPVAHARAASISESRRRAAVEHLLCRLELPWAMVEGDLEDGYRRLARHETQGLVCVFEGRITVTEAGRHILPALCDELHAAWPAHSDTLMRWAS